MFEFTVWDVVRNLLMAMRWTIGLSLIAFVGGALAGGLLVVLRLTGNRLIRLVVMAYVQVFQGTPLLLQLFLVYFGLSMFGIQTSALVAASICLTLYTSAYLTEIWRGCILSVDRGQWEAGSSLALSFGEQLRYVIVPQAVRIGIAPTVGFMVQVIKATALTSVIGFVEMTRAGQVITNATLQPFLIYGLVALMYFAVCFPLSLYSRRLENSLRR
ncbi:amino acid ABC transporter permease [Pseudomonas syringae]|uniref:amino acid ABC transporter permease n=1 Tax=Pseudomonas syringae TaxID=317 RepID=UPI00028D6F93|nr:amino acid ABC transporter permease [Pseudomonas syringae]EKG35782.1 Putative amino acid ABC transporter, permease protein [Pseudomonas syringae pv. avellanae str. ISPaVe037]